MDITPQDTTQQPISDDQELAKALAGVMPDAPEPTVPSASPVADAMAFEETPPVSSAAVTPTAPSAPVSSSDLDTIKKDALVELRPLMGKLNMSSEETFNVYLMLIRSTDDSSLIGPAHTAAQGITDEKRKAEALLEIIKEIDYLSQSQQKPASQV
jgi:hypothetical protein